MPDIVEKAREKALAGDGLTFEEGCEFAALPDENLYEVLAATEAVRRKFKGTEVNLCGIVNAKSGLCAEDCTFCSQSTRYETGVETYRMASAEAIAEAAREAAKNGAREFSIVTSGTKVASEKDVSILTDALASMKETTGVERCASLGMLSPETLKTLKEAGLESYHHNLETGRSFFPKICTTHDYEEDVATIRTARELGFYTCSGGIFGLGEGWEHRVELAETLRELDVDSVPINFLNPRPGTPLEEARNLTPVECLKIIALMRLMLPTKDIVVCGGREMNLRGMQPLIFAAGANGMMIGNYLTTKGRNTAEDLQMLRDLGLTPRGNGHP
ncbi:MAG: biotin synthase BioB [Thermodesulfobacteriota bacterium]